ncbi:MAG: hypothetical protein JO122_13695 [Acetobacteraceae bacterium]|nr:hypothetical protein [Acetobacteraceae bacterium]
MNRFVPLTLAFAFAAAMPVAAFAQTPKQPGKHDTAKGAAAGAVIGHEMGSGHAVAGAAAGAAIGHHEKHKAQQQANTNG